MIINRLISILLVFSFCIAEAGIFSCRVELSNSTNEKVLLLEQATAHIGQGLIKSDSILESPETFREFLNRLNKTEFVRVSEKDLNQLVTIYLKNHFEDELNLKDEKKLSKSSSLEVLSSLYTDQLSQALKAQGIEIKRSRFNYGNRLKSLLFTAIWSGLYLKTQTLMPIYLPNYSAPKMSPQKRSEVVNQISVLSPAEAIRYIEKEVPGVRPLNFYRSIRSLYNRLTAAAFVGVLLFSPPSLNLMDQYTPFGAQMRWVKQETRLRWDEVFADREEMKVHAIAVIATMEGADLQDRATYEKIKNRVEALSFEELHEFLR